MRRSFLPVFPSRSSFRLWRNLVSVVDQQAWLAAGRVRRLLVRVLLVLGGAFAVTAIGWLLCAGTANAGELPAVPSVPSVVAGVGAAVAQVSTQDVAAPELPSTPLPDTGLANVTQQVHLPATAVGDRLVPAVAPVVEPLVPVQPKAHRWATVVAQPMSQPAAATVPVRSVTTEPVQYKHVPGHATQQSTSHRTAATPPLRTRPHAPSLPPLQPAGSSDANAHGGGSVAGGPGGPQAPFQHVLGNGLDLAGTPSAPRLAVVPGQQPGTSPD